MSWKVRERESKKRITSKIWRAVWKKVEIGEPLEPNPSRTWWKTFWSTGLTLAESQKTTVFTRVAQVVYVALWHQQTVLIDSSLAFKVTCTRKKHLIKQGFQLLHSCHQQIKFKKTNQLENNTKHQKMMLGNSEISDGIQFLIMSSCLHQIFKVWKNERRSREEKKAKR